MRGAMRVARESFIFLVVAVVGDDGRLAVRR